MAALLGGHWLFVVCWGYKLALLRLGLESLEVQLKPQQLVTFAHVLSFQLLRSV
jgi:hypothetical protein